MEQRSSNSKSNREKKWKIPMKKNSNINKKTADYEQELFIKKL